MFARCLATVLLLLAASPFTAPFCSVRLSELFDLHPAAAYIVAADMVDEGAAVEEASAHDPLMAHVLPVSRLAFDPCLVPAVPPGAVFAAVPAHSQRPPIRFSDFLFAASPISLRI